MYELIYTSVKNGLMPGKSGFTSVAWTIGMPPMYVGILEGLSTYDPFYPPEHPLANENPVNHTYRKIPFGRKTLRIFSRIAYAGLDYSGRSNIIAHHIIAEDGDVLWQGNLGPVSVFLNPKNFRTEWHEEPHQLTSRNIALPAQEDIQSYLRQEAWQTSFGNPRWAEACARKAIANKRKSQCLYCVVPEGMTSQRALALIAEAAQHIPQQELDDFTFSTYFTRQPSNSTDTNCIFRCVLPSYKYLPAVQRVQPQNIISKDTDFSLFCTNLPPEEKKIAPVETPEPTTILNGQEIKTISPSATIHIDVISHTESKPPRGNAFQSTPAASAPNRPAPPNATSHFTDDSPEMESEGETKRLIIPVILTTVAVLAIIVVGIFIWLPQWLFPGEQTQPIEQQQLPYSQTSDVTSEEHETDGMPQRKPDEKQNKEKTTETKETPAAQPSPSVPTVQQPQKSTEQKIDDKTFKPTEEQQYHMFIAVLWAHKNMSNVANDIGYHIPPIKNTEPQMENARNLPAKIAFVFEDGKTYEVKLNFNPNYLNYLEMGIFEGMVYKHHKDVRLLLDYQYIRANAPDDSGLYAKANEYNKCLKLQTEPVSYISDDVFEKKVKGFEENIKNLREALERIKDSDNSNAKKDTRQKADKMAMDASENKSSRKGKNSKRSTETQNELSKEEEEKVKKDIIKYGEETLGLFIYLCNNWEKQTKYTYRKLDLAGKQASYRELFDSMNRDFWKDLGKGAKWDDEANKTFRKMTKPGQGEKLTKKQEDIRQRIESINATEKEREKGIDDFRKFLKGKSIFEKYPELRRKMEERVDAKEEIKLNEEPLLSLYQRMLLDTIKYEIAEGK